MSAEQAWEGFERARTNWRFQQIAMNEPDVPPWPSTPDHPAAVTADFGDVEDSL